jgi:hypothetical protein
MIITSQFYAIILLGTCSIQTIFHSKFIFSIIIYIYVLYQISYLINWYFDLDTRMYFAQSLCYFILCREKTSVQSFILFNILSSTWNESSVTLTSDFERSPCWCWWWRTRDTKWETSSKWRWQISWNGTSGGREVTSPHHHIYGCDDTIWRPSFLRNL